MPLADNETRLVVSATRTELLKMKDDGKAVLTKLAGVLGMKPAGRHGEGPALRRQDAPALLERLALPADPHHRRGHRPAGPADPRARRGLPRHHRRTQAVRRYAGPGKANTAQVLGYLSPVTDEEITKAQDTGSPYLRSDQVGRSGLERQYDKELRGKAGVTRYEVDNLGRVIGEAEGDPAEPGANLVTSIDARVQRVAEYELNEAMKDARKQLDDNTGSNYKADSGAVVVMEAKTGRVVAMASNPTYDPNAWVGGISAKDYATLTGKKSNFPLLNRAIQGQAAPGSIFKVISTAAAVNAGYAFDGHYQCSSSYSIGGQVFKNFESQGYGSISLGRALEVSCDTVFYRLAHEQWKQDGGIKPKKNAKDWFYKTAHQFGLGEETGIDLPNEVTGRVPDRKWKQDFWTANKDDWCKYGKKDGTYVEKIAYENCLEGNQMRAGDSVNYSIGQGDTLVTPIQMATIYAAISNGGTLYDPTVGKAVDQPRRQDRSRRSSPRRTASCRSTQKTLAQIDEALEGVATRGTAAWRFGGWPQDKIPMHAKTGTAEVYGKQTTSWFTTYTKDYAVVMTISQGGTGPAPPAPPSARSTTRCTALDEDGSRSTRRPCCPPRRRASRRSSRTAPSTPRRSSRTTRRRRHRERQPARPARLPPATARPPDEPGSSPVRTRTARRPDGAEDAMTGANTSPSPGTDPSAARWAKLLARDSLARRLDWPILLSALALSFIGALLVCSATRNRTELNQGDPYYFLIRHVTEHRHRPRPDDRHRSGSATAPCAPPYRSSTASRSADPAGAHPARRHHQRRPRVDRVGGGFSLQPSEFVKITIILGMAMLLAARVDAGDKPYPDHRTVAPGARPGRRPDDDRHAHARPRVGHGHGHHRARRPARLRRLQPLGLRPARRGRRRRDRRLAARRPRRVPDQPLRGLRQPRTRPRRRRLQHQPGPHRHRLRRTHRHRPLPGLPGRRPSSRTNPSGRSARVATPNPRTPAASSR